jgi:hypothetical protein
MKFKDLSVNDVFTVNGQSVQYMKVPEERVSCCKIGCNAKTVSDQQSAVFRPLDEVTKIEK